MSLTIVVTRNTPDKVRGFLCSCMVEIAAGVYVSAFLTRRAREQIWEEIAPFGDGSISVIMVAENFTLPQRCQTWVAGEPTREMAVLDGMLISGKRL